MKITRLPLSQLGTPNCSAVRTGEVGREAIRELLRAGQVRFVVADVGHQLDWVPEADCCDFWRREVQTHLVEPDEPVDLDGRADGYVYFASQWDDGAGPIVVLEKAH